MKRRKANSLENFTWSESGKQNISAKKVYFSWILQIAREIEDNGDHATLWFFFFFGGVGDGEDKQGALSGLGEIVNFPFVALLS